MDAAARKRIVAQLARAFGAASDVTPAPGQDLHVLLGKVDLPEPWSPSPTRPLTIWRSWPTTRPEFYVPQDVVDGSGSPPRNPSPAYHLGESWNTFSFSFAWAGDDPVRAVQLWLTRFSMQPA